MSSIYRFADLTLDTGRYALQRDGGQIDLPKLSYELLLALVKASPNLLTQEDIVERVWQGRYVSPETVTQRIKLLRDALGDDAARPRYILGVRGRGYRLVPAVDRLPIRQVTVNTTLRRALIAGGAGLAALALLWILRGTSGSSGVPATEPAIMHERTAIAVLPFQNLSPDPENAYFAAGIHNDMVAELASIRSLKVISRSSVLDYESPPSDPRAIAGELGVSAILEGSVQRAGGTVHVNVQLLDAETDSYMWAKTYNEDVTAENLFSIQANMATSVARALRAILTPNELERLSAVPTKNTKAYEFYLSGNDYFARPDDRAFMKLAVQQYQRATVEDPNFARAWAALSRAHCLMYWYSIDATPARLELAWDAAQRALQLDADLPQAHIALAQYYFQGFRDYEAALKEFALAEQEMTGTSELYQSQAMILRRMGNWAQAFAALDRAAELDPRSMGLLVRHAGTYLSYRDYASAEQSIRRALDIEPDNAMSYLWKVWIPIYRDGDVSLAKAAAANPPIELGRWRGLLGWSAALYERDYDTALRYLDDWELDVFAQQMYYIPKASYYGVTYMLAGQNDLAYEQFRIARTHLEKALALNPKDARRHVSMAEAMMGLGERDAAMREAYRAIELLPTAEDAMAGPMVQEEAVKRVFAPMGEIEAVIEELDAFLSIPGGSWSIEGLLPDPRFDPVRDDPRFQALVKKYRREPPQHPPDLTSNAVDSYR